MQHKQIALIPWWIDQVLKRNGLKSEDLLSFETVSKYLSNEDITGLIALEYLAKHFVYGDIAGDIVCWRERWSKNSAQIDSLYAIANTEETLRDTLYRVCAPEGPALGGAVTSGSYVGPAVTDTSTVSLMGDSGVAVVFNAGYSVGEHASNSIALLRLLVKTLYVYEDYHKLMSRPVGASYVESLMH